MVTELKENTEILFRNIESLLGSITDPDLLLENNKWPIGEQILHLLNSMDAWFINPYDTAESAIPADKRSLHSLNRCYAIIKRKIDSYLCDLNKEDMFTYPEKCGFSKLELIFAQTRHIMYHIGVINGILYAKHDRELVYSGLQSDEDNQRRT